MYFNCRYNLVLLHQRMKSSRRFKIWGSSESHHINLESEISQSDGSFFCSKHKMNWSFFETYSRSTLHAVSIQVECSHGGKFEGILVRLSVSHMDFHPLSLLHSLMVIGGFQKILSSWKRYGQTIHFCSREHLQHNSVCFIHILQGVIKLLK